MTLQVGLGKTELQVFEKNIGMMGYGHPKNIVLSQATPLYARSIIIKNNETVIILCVAELAFISMALKKEITAALKNKYLSIIKDESQVLISAQHTHSAPGGFTHYPFYNFTIPGFRPKIFNSIKEGIINSIEVAFQNLSHANLFFGTHQIDPVIPIAFNRSIEAFNNNPEKSHSLFDLSNPIDRCMNEILIKDENGKIKGCINLFGVHCTSVNNTNTQIHHDNKGVAAVLWEQHFPNAVSLFAQASAGDISPNYILDKNTNHMRGPHLDSHQNARDNGALQFGESIKIQSTEKIVGSLFSKHCFVDFTKLCAEPAHGIAFLKGTSDGRGIGHWVAKLLKIPAKLNHFFMSLSNKNKKFLEQQGAKEIAVDHRNGKFFGISFNLFRFLRFVPDPIVQELAKEVSNGALITKPWVPSHLPLQIIGLGQIIILAVPGEITTVAAYRLKQKMKKYFLKHKILVWSYCNAYMGYFTTPEEYDVQCYEGGHTIYGRNSLPTLINSFELLAQDLIDSQTPPEFPVAELKLRTYNSL